MWRSSGFWELHKQIKIASMEALQEYLIRGMLNFEFRMFSSCELSKHVRIKIYETLNFPRNVRIWM